MGFTWGRRGVLRSVLVAAVVLSITGGAAPRAVAQDVGGYADWTMGGESHAYTGTMTLPGEFPAATFDSDARAASRLNSGGSAWLSPGTPFGEVFGDGEKKPYPTLRPYADRPDSPSTTTFVFDSPTPTGGWGFTLGDIDADAVEVAATDAHGNPVPVVNLGYQGVFNYCDASPRPGVCSGVTEYDTPTWIPGTTSGRLVGDGVDEVGGSGWFRPTAAITTLSLTFTRLSGFPVYQIWFARLADPDEPDPSAGPSDGPSDDASAGPSGGPASTVPGGPGGDDGLSLPITGSTPLPVAGLGLALILGGAAVVWWSRRVAHSGE